MAYNYNEYIAKYNKENIQMYTLKLNKKTDKDVIEAIGNKNKQGTIKELIRKAISQ